MPMFSEYGQDLELAGLQPPIAGPIHKDRQGFAVSVDVRRCKGSEADAGSLRAGPLDFRPMVGLALKSGMDVGNAVDREGRRDSVFGFFFEFIRFI